MADRRLEVPHTQMLESVEYPLRAQSYGATHPVFVEGDRPGQSSGAWMALQRGATGPVARGWTGASGGPTGMTGVYVVRTQDPFPGLVGLDVAIIVTTPNGTLGYELLAPRQESDGTWTIPFRVFNVTDGVSTDIPSGGGFCGTLVLRNSNQKP